MEKKISIAIFTVIIVAVILVGAFVVPSYLANPSSINTNDTITVVDHLDRTVEVPANVTRIVSLHSISTQIVYAVGGQSQLFAVDETSRTNKVLQRIDPDVVDLTGVVGESNQPNVEEIVNLNPDLVIVSSYYPESAEALADAGLTVIAFNFHNRATTDSIQLIGKAIGRQDAAAKLCDYYAQKESMITTRIAEIPVSERPTVMYVSTSSSTEGLTVWKIAGNQAFQHSLITKAGGVNIGEDLDGIWFNESPEQMLQWDPQYIYTSATNSGFETGTAPTTVLTKLKADAVLSELDAVKQGNFYYLVRLEFATATNSPESILGIEMMAKTLHPDTFTDIDLNSEVKEFFSTFYNCQLSDAEVDVLLNPGA